VHRKGAEVRTAIIRGASTGVGLGIAENLVLVDGDIIKKDTSLKVTDAAPRHVEGIDLLNHPFRCFGIND
jgi:hypothetical protein